MELNKLKKDEFYVHTGLMYEPRRNEPLRFISPEKQKGGLCAKFAWVDNGSKILVAEWAVEEYVELYKFKSE
jgi:hypothetical protein